MTRLSIEKTGMRQPGGMDVMVRYDPGFDRSGVSPSLGTQIGTRIPGASPENSFNDFVPQTEALNNKILSCLPAPEFRRLLLSFEPIALSTGEEINGVNEFNEFVYFPESAVISHLYRLNNGGVTAAAVIGNDGLVGLSAVFGSPPPVYRTTVMVGGGGLRVKAQVIRQEFARGERLQRLILTYMSKRLAQVSQRAVCNGRHKLTERLYTWLLMIDDRTKGRILPLTHADISNHLGARRAVISGCCHSLRTSGMITYKRGEMIILDRKMLEAGACECYYVLKQ
jgi:CRP-like cAMP-binding protein